MGCVIVMFIVGILMPFTLILSAMKGDLPREVEYAAVALVLFVTALIVLRPYFRRREALGPRPPRAGKVAKLDWPENLPTERFEAYCEEYLRQQGWEVSPALSNAAHGVFLEANCAAGRVVLLCEQRAPAVTPLAVRSVASAALERGDARGVVVTQGRLAPVSEQAAIAEGVTLLQVKDLPNLPSYAVAPAPPPPPAPPPASVPPGPDEPVTPPPP